MSGIAQILSPQPANVRSGSSATKATKARDAAPGGRKRLLYIWTVFVVLVVLLLLGFSFHIAGGLIHVVLLAALALLIINFLGGRRRAT
jgi:fatty acid desaturase